MTTGNRPIFTDGVAPFVSDWNQIALGLDAWRGIQVDLGHPALDGLAAEAVPAGEGGGVLLDRDVRASPALTQHDGWRLLRGVKAFR